MSLGVVVTALIIRQTGWLWLDPAASIVVTVAILWSGWRLMGDALNLALDAVPAGIDRTAVEAYLTGLSGVIEVHDPYLGNEHHGNGSDRAFSAPSFAIG